GLLSAPLRDRFGAAYRLDFYTTEELGRIIARSARLLDFEIEPAARNELAKRSRGTPRIANRLLRRVRDYAQVRAGGVIDRGVAAELLRMIDVDEFGLDDMDARILKTIIEKFEGGPVGLSSIGTAVGEDANTIEEVFEPFLVQNGFLQRTTRGRIATPKAYAHFGYVRPAAAQAELL
ncbi:MAG: Holliday junction DNA helicase RuvB C-terminal domain-containing protein, partial [Gemmatimonadaceae bacterium]